MRDTETTTFNESLATSNTSWPVAIEIFYRGQVQRLEAEQMPFVIGRDSSSCQLAVQSSMASRKHCTLDMKCGQLGVTDHSTNGTMVKVGQGNSLRVKDRFFPLTGQGCLSLGEDIAQGDTNLVWFKMVRAA